MKENYKYKAQYRAYSTITIGNLVTSKTDQGDYVVEPNGQLTLKAGDFISIQPGTHFKAGAIVHIVPEYEACNVQRMSHNNQNTENNYVFQNIQIAEQEKPLPDKLLVYPNPSLDVVLIETEKKAQLSHIVLFTLNGKILHQEQIEKNIFRLDINHLPKGLYFLRVVQQDGTMYNSKIEKL